jgi:hypothetical protein
MNTLLWMVLEFTLIVCNKAQSVNYVLTITINGATCDTCIVIAYWYEKASLLEYSIETLLHTRVTINC